MRAPKNAAEKLSGQIRQGEGELDYLESVLEELSRCVTERDFSEVRQELTESGYIPQKKRRAEKQR
jgi:hypothetical protein